MIRQIALLLIRGYQIMISPLLHPSCRFLPTCSSYASICIERFGVGRGFAMALRRLLKCHPWGESGYDPPPSKAVTANTQNAAFFSRKTKLWTGKQ